MPDNTLTKLVFDGLTNTFEIVDLTQDEIDELEQINAKSDAVFEAIEAKAAARQSALAKLAELGLTEEEIAAL